MAGSASVRDGRHALAGPPYWKTLLVESPIQIYNIFACFGAPGLVRRACAAARPWRNGCHVAAWGGWRGWFMVVVALVGGVGWSAHLLKILSCWFTDLQLYHTISCMSSVSGCMRRWRAVARQWGNGGRMAAWDGWRGGGINMEP